MLPFLGSRDLDIIDKVIEEVSVPTNRSLKLLPYHIWKIRYWLNYTGMSEAMTSLIYLD